MLPPEGLQTSPFGLHPTGLRHTPTALGVMIAHVTGVDGLAPAEPSEPQQSRSSRHASDTGRHPLGR